MRWTVASIGMAGGASLLAAAWMAWVISQGTGQFIEQGWPALRYAAPLAAALVIAVGALVTVNVRPPAKSTLRVAIGVTAGLEILVFGVFWFSLVFGVFWFSLVVVPFPA